MEKYKLRLTFNYWKTKRTKGKIVRSFVWDNKEDALECKRIMAKSISHSEITMEFVTFTEEIEI